MRPRRLPPGNRFTWRFKTKDYWEAVVAPGPIESVKQLMLLHEPWVTSDASKVLGSIHAHGGQPSLDQEGMIVVEIDEKKLDLVNSELAGFQCRLSNQLLHTV